MKKILLYGFKYFNHFTNEKLSAEEEAEYVLRYLLLKSTPIHTLAVNEALQRKLLIIMREEEQKAIKTKQAINYAYKIDCAFSFNPSN